MLEVIKTRRSIRKFRPDPVAEPDVHALLEAAMCAPSAVNEQAWQFVVLSADVLERYLALNSNAPTGAPTGILVCRDLAREKAPGYSVQDCSAAVQNILLAAHALGLGAVWTAVFPDHHASVRTLLSLPATVEPFAFIPIGHPAERPAAVDRFDATRVHRNGW